MTGIDEILAEASNPAYVRRARARLLLRQDLLTEHAELEQQLQQQLGIDARTNITPKAPAIAAQLLELEERIEDAKHEFVFHGIGHRKWADIIAKHPPTKEQLKAAPRIDHNPETFPIAAIAASCQSPAMTVDQVKALEAALDESRFSQLWRACCEANVGGGDSPKSMVAGGILRANAELGITAAPAESLGPSSSEGL